MHDAGLDGRVEPCRPQSALPRRDPKTQNRSDLTGKMNGWKSILNTLTVHYGDRIAANTIN
jgi:hypothetical protein